MSRRYWKVVLGPGSGLAQDCIGNGYVGAHYGATSDLSSRLTAVIKDDTELFKQFMDNDGFKRWMTDTVFDLTYLT